VFVLCAKNGRVDNAVYHGCVLNGITVDPRVTTGLTYEQLGLRPKLILVLTNDQILSYDPHAGQGHFSYDPHGVRKLQSEPRYACLWT
jgi:hypothetical protein